MEKFQTTHRWHGSTTRLAGIVLILAVFMSVLPGPAQAASLAKKSTCSHPYVVRVGDTLNKIAKAYDLRFEELIEANHLTKPYVIYAGQKLCLSDSKKAGPSGHKTSEGTNLAASFTLKIAKGQITIRTSNFPKENIFFVKAGELSTIRYTWYRVSTFFTKKSVSHEASFKLPKELQKSGFITVCLKNVETNAVVCRTAYHLK